MVEHYAAEEGKSKQRFHGAPARDTHGNSMEGTRSCVAEVTLFLISGMRFEVVARRTELAEVNRTMTVCAKKERNLKVLSVLRCFSYSVATLMALSFH